jgi:hypothetical protein
VVYSYVTSLTKLTCYANTVQLRHLESEKITCLNRVLPGANHSITDGKCWHQCFDRHSAWWAWSDKYNSQAYHLRSRAWWALRLSPAELVRGDASADGHVRVRPRQAEVGYKPAAAVRSASSEWPVYPFSRSLLISHRQPRAPCTTVRTP